MENTLDVGIIFYFLLGILAILALALLIRYMRQQQLTLPWWQWLAMAGGLALALYIFRAVYIRCADDCVNVGRLVALVFGLVSIGGATLLGRRIFKRSNDETE